MCNTSKDWMSMREISKHLLREQGLGSMRWGNKLEDMTVSIA
jgi:hypothetical protein